MFFYDSIVIVKSISMIFKFDIPLCDSNINKQDQ
jgi:hypothetical protein